MKPVGCCGGERTPQSSLRLASSAQGTPFWCPKEEPSNTSLQTPYEIKLPTCTRKHLNINITDTGKGNNRRWQAPGGQRVQRANSAGRFRCGCPRKLLSSGKSAGRCRHRPLHVPRDSAIKPNISGTAIDNRRWQAPGGQRVQRANSAGRFRCGCPRKLLSSGKSAGRCGHRPLHVPRDFSVKSNTLRKEFPSAALPLFHVKHSV